MNQHHEDSHAVGMHHLARLRKTLSKFDREWKNKRVIHSHNGAMVITKTFPRTAPTIESPKETNHV